MAAAAGGGAPRALSQKEQDVQMMLAADVHLGTKNCDFQMERYVFKRRTDGTDHSPPHVDLCRQIITSAVLVFLP